MSDYERDSNIELEDMREEEEEIEEAQNIGQIGVSHNAAKIAVKAAIKEIRLRSLGNVKPIEGP